MRWEMEMEEIEAVLERIWDLHDKISDAIHAISRSHFLRSVKTLGKPEMKHRETEEAAGGDDDRGGFVFVKGFGVTDDAALAEARSLNNIRNALESLEDQLEFFHTVQSQQRAERDAAVARLEQSRIVLAMRLAEHQGKKYKVIEEARAFVGDVHETTGHFVAPENLFEIPRNNDNHDEKQSNFLMQMLMSSLSIAKRTFRLENFSGLVMNASVFAVSMLALLQLHQMAFKSETEHANDQTFPNKRKNKNLFLPDPSSTNQQKQFNVLSARG
ncbi:Histone-like protein H-NS N-terminal protein [Dioscorea alata]|uniref:Histone-like protein H-NS N-terminal protein n=1 Tax=Dioscorea alata TaxID=55571 RepID=A0ACB7UD27_DIOAL|nr:Histone-like protein H-NS N-terminal protein [Dioscorea alata]